MSFNVEIDIANRACQHMGSRTISVTEGFNEDSVQAHEISTCFDQLRVAELRRNLWRFSTRRSVIRPIGFNTMLLSPPLWSSVTTYFPGAIVSTVDGALWISTAQDNINNAPGGSVTWDGYFGPLTCDAWDGDETYFAGDVAFRVATNGAVTVFLSLVNGNGDAPGTPQTWASLNSDGDPLYYFKDQIVTYSGVTYQSKIDLNGSNTPGLSPAGWLVGTTYAAGNQISGSDGVVYTSISAGNVGHNPAGGAAPSYWTASGLANPPVWLVGTTYAAGAKVTGSDGLIYSSFAGANIGHDPTASSLYWANTGAYSPWTTTITNGSGGSLNWTQINIALVKLTLAYPIGSGPVEETNTRNVYHLPAGYLRQAPQNPKGGTNFLGGPSGNSYNDWDIESDYLVTQNSQPIVFRFGADIRSVRAMDPMFCEGLGARIALECVERVTQSNSKYATIDMAYKKVMGDARVVNGIETGPTEPPEDELITVRQ